MSRARGCKTLFNFTASQLGLGHAAKIVWRSWILVVALKWLRIAQLNTRSMLALLYSFDGVAKRFSMAQLIDTPHQPQTMYVGL